MNEQTDGQDASSHDLFLIELRDGEQVRYVLTERFLVIDPGQSAMGVPWGDLAALFRGRTLRAVPLPGRRSRSDRMEGGVGTDPGVGTDSGASTNIEVNLLKIGKGD